MNRFKKISNIVLATVVAMTMLTGCGNKAAGTEDNKKVDGTPQLKLGIWPEDTLADQIKLQEGYKAKFEAKYPNIEVVPANYKYSNETFVPMAEAGNLPTIFETWYTEPQKLIKGGYVADITDILKEKGWLDAMNPSIRTLLSDKDGKVYGIPRDGYALGIMLNVQLFKEAGLVDASGYPVEPKTFEELAKTAKTIKDKTGKAGFVLLAKDNAGGWQFTNIAWAFGATLTTQDSDGKFKSNIDTKEAVAAMQYVKDLKWKYDVLTADPTNEDWATGFAALGTGTAAMYIAANDAVGQPTETNGLPAKDLALMAMPAGPDGKQFSLAGGTPYMFSKDATKEEISAALDYLEIMGKAPIVTPDSLAGMESGAQYCVDKGIPVIKSFPSWINKEMLDAQDAIVKKFANVDAKLYGSYFDAVAKEGNLRLEEPGSAQDLYAELTKVLQAVVTDKDANIEALMKKANDNYQKILDEKLNK